MTKFKVGDIVKLNEEGKRQWCNNRYRYKRKTFKVAIARCGGGVCVYNDTDSGWITESMGLYRYFIPVIQENKIGGELV